MKLAAMERLGAVVRIVPAAEGDGKAAAFRLAAETGAMMIEDGAHREIAAGAGVIGLELTEAGVVPDMLVIQLGDGALAAGIGSWLRVRSPRTRIVGIVAHGAPAMMRSLTAGRVIETDHVDTIADGMAIRSPIADSVALLKHCIDEVVAVEDAAIVDAARLLLQKTGILVEPSGAAGIAAVAAHPEKFAGKAVAGVLTGSNLSPEFQRMLLSG
jgi:threonine dehydratase